jgi:archaetidylinositol phosphate synthase
MLNPLPLVYPDTSVRRPWDARMARYVVAPLVNSRVTPNHLTTLRLGAGLAAAAAFAPGGYGWSNLGAFLLVLSNFLDHTDGELARMSGKTSRFGHFYDLASDALVTMMLFVAIGVGTAESAVDWGLPPVALGAVAGIAIALIFYLRMRIEDLHGKAATRQASLGGFETEDVLYLFPLVTLSDALTPLLILASIFAPLYAVRVVIEYHRLLRRDRRVADGVAG